MSQDNYCPLCNAPTIPHRTSNNIRYINCTCQDYIKDDSTYKITQDVFEDNFQNGQFSAGFRNRNEKKLMTLRYYHCKAQQNNPEGRLIDDTFIAQAINLDLPTIVEQLDNLILTCGQRENENKVVTADFSSLGHIIGTGNANTFDAIIKKAKNEYLESVNPAKLQFNGWLKYEELSRGTPKGNGAFMAMKFGNCDLEKMFEQCFVPAVRDTGFCLKKLNDTPKAGLIDNRLRQEIRLARFVIADLTDKNNGAYWEAGYAEGLGKPVIYMCEESVFEAREIHFDTNHHQTIIWHIDDQKNAGDSLKATIRCTISEAKQSDE